MSALRRSLMNKFPPLPSKPGGFNNKRRSRDFSPLSWRDYFESCADVRVPCGDVFRVYRSGCEGPLLVLLHGGGFSALSWSLLTYRITRSVRCQVLAIDLRGHGDTVTADETDLSMDTLISDIQSVVCELFVSVPCAVLVGHSMGGALATRAAHNWTACPLAGLVVIDVVEGSAIDALSSMNSYLRNRPRVFQSIPHAIEWSVRCGMIRNVESARVSMPGQLKNSATGVSAVEELQLSPSISTESCTSAPSISAPASATPSASSIREETEEGGDSSGESVSSSSSSTHSLPPPPPQPHSSSVPSPTSAVPQQEYTWRIDLSLTERHWHGWFEGLSAAFLTATPAKLLLLAGVDRLDRELTVGQMQGKFQIQVLPKSGHAVHEDAPDHVADALSGFLVRNKLTEALQGFSVMPPSC